MGEKVPTSTDKRKIYPSMLSTTTAYLRLPTVLHKAAEKHAAMGGISIAAVLRQWIEEGFKRDKRNAG